MSTPLQTKRRISKQFEQLAGVPKKYTRPHDAPTPHVIAWSLTGMPATVETTEVVE